MRKSVKIIITALCFSLIWMTTVPISMAEDQGSESGANTGNKVEESTSRFSDINGHWAEKTIKKYADEDGFINGYPDGTFKPDDCITRAEFSKMLVVAFDLSEDVSSEEYTDLDKAEWYYPYVLRAAKYLTSPHNEKFNICRPEDNAWRSEAAQALSEIKMEKYQIVMDVPDDIVVVLDDLAQIYHGEYDLDPVVAGPHGPIDQSIWMLNNVWLATKLNVMQGYDDGYFKPNNTLTRAEALIVIDRVLNTDDSGDEK